MSWGRFNTELQVKRSTVQRAYERWYQAGVFKQAIGRHRSFDIELPAGVVPDVLQDPKER
jgi:hypothetical protein